MTATNKASKKKEFLANFTKAQIKEIETTHKNLINLYKHELKNPKYPRSVKHGIKRQIRLLKNWKTYCIFFNEYAALFVVEFIATLSHTEGELGGEPIELEDWQILHIIYPIFGWKKVNKKGKEVRMYQEAYIQIPRKNGKSTLVSAIACYMYLADNERGAEIYAAAVDKNQAKIVWDKVFVMLQDSRYSKHLKFNISLNKISKKADIISYIKPLSLYNLPYCLL